MMLYTWFDDEEERYCYEAANHVCKHYVGEGHNTDLSVGLGVQRCSA